MKKELLSIADYLEALEQRLTKLEAVKQRLALLEARVTELESKVSELEARPLPETLNIPETPNIPDIPATPDTPPILDNIDIQLEQEMKMATMEARLIELESKAETPSTEVAAPAPASSSATVNAPKVDDIRHAISLGDRFLFQRELFGQNGEQMQKTLEALNKQPDLDSAVAYLDKHFGSWDKDSTAYQLFYNVLQRRF